MELKDYLKIIRKNILFLLIFTLVGAALGFLLLFKLSQGFRLEQQFYISPQFQQNDLYGNYWTQEKARNFTDTAVSILGSPQFMADHIKTAGSLEVRKSAPQLIRVTATAQTSREAQNILNEALFGFNTQIKDLSPELTLELKPLNNPQPAFSGPAKNLGLAAGALLGLTFGFLVVGLKSYLKL